MSYQTRKDKHNAERAARRSRKRAFIIECLGTCVECGTSQNIELDHIDSGVPKDSRNIYELAARSDEVILKELERCQALCHDCHKKKSMAEQRAKQQLWQELTPEERERRVTAAKLSM